MDQLIDESTPESAFCYQLFLLEYHIKLPKRVAKEYIITVDVTERCMNHQKTLNLHGQDVLIIYILELHFPEDFWMPERKKKIEKTDSCCTN
jgi:hypothetical protein